MIGNSRNLKNNGGFCFLFGCALVTMAIWPAVKASSSMSMDEQSVEPKDDALFVEATDEPTIVEGQQQQQQQLEESDVQQQEATSTNTCEVHNNEPLHALMDRICELCHDMYSHQKPEMRADCRSDCFRSNHFKRCLRLFRPIANNRSRHRGMRHMAEAMSGLMSF